AKELGGAAPLLREVGGFRGQAREGEESIYDLGGNVAEWVLTRDGKGRVIGGSADCPALAGSRCTPAPQYVGFRVVRGPAKPQDAVKTPCPSADLAAAGRSSRSSGRSCSSPVPQRPRVTTPRFKNASTAAAREPECPIGCSFRPATTRKTNIRWFCGFTALP